MIPLTINDIKEWLLTYQKNHEKLKEQEFPPLFDVDYWLYIKLNQVMEFYSLTDKTHTAIQDFITIENFDYEKLVRWTKIYEELGSEDLSLFEIEYFDWIEEVDKDLIKISEGVFMELAPFKETQLFCRLFQILFWDYNVTEADLSNEEIKNLRVDLITVLTNN